MKKTLIALMALASVAMGANGDLTLLYDFDALEATGKGTGTMTQNTWDYDRTVYDVQGGRAYVGIEDSTVTNILNGTDQNTCLTIAFWTHSGYNNSNYQMLFGWGENQTGWKFGFDHRNLCGTTPGRSDVKGGSVKSGEWVLIAATVKSTSITSTVEGTTTTTPALTIVLRDVTNGQVYDKGDVTYVAPTVAGNTFSVLSANSNNVAENYKGLLSGVGIYTSTGDVNDVTNAAIATAMGAAPVLIPEPATATLSLLALAGLAARRRRR